jgi:hypothetical protein
MEPVEFEGQTLVLRPPRNWNETQPVKCGGLPIQRTEIQGVPCLISHWKPSAEDLAALNAGGVVSLVVYGVQHPPVWLETAKVLADIDRKPAGES